MNYDNNYKELAQRVKKASIKMATSSHETRIEALKNIKKALINNKDIIFTANKKDLENGLKKNIPLPIQSRLKFNDEKLQSCLDGIDSLISLKDPLGSLSLKRELDTNLLLERIVVPLGVIGVIFESRPDALLQISTLCIKSGNCAILKGGSEAQHTNSALFKTIYDAGIKSGLPENFIGLIEDRQGITAILDMDKSIDLIIPRGSNEFVQHIMSNTKIPVMGHADGICHMYIDKYADIEKAIKLINDSKTQYVAACNTLETLLVHKDLSSEFLNKLDKKIKIREGNFNEEYLDYILTLKFVSSLEEAIDSINENGSHHTDCIVTEDEESAQKFKREVDSAGVYHNCSTRFADGFRYGFGAEVGISTGKLHARGPVGIEGLVTYKYLLKGDGHVVDDYSTGKKSFNFKDFE